MFVLQQGKDSYIYTHWFVTFSISSVAINFISRFVFTVIFPEKVLSLFAEKVWLVYTALLLPIIVDRWFVTTIRLTVVI
jgi:hypothetical protein